MGNQAISRGAKGDSDFPSCCEGKLGIPFELLQWNQALSRFEGGIGVLSTSSRKLGVPLKVQLVRQAFSESEGDVGIPLELKLWNRPSCLPADPISSDLRMLCSLSQDSRSCRGSKKKPKPLLPSEADPGAARFTTK